MKKMIRRSGEKRFLSLLLCVLMMTALLPALNTRAEATQSMSGNFLGYTAKGNPVDDIAACAEAQNGRKQSSFGYTEAWCADFVSDCAKIVGQSDAIPFNTNCNNLRNAVINAGGRYVSTPAKGDLIFWGGNHVALMVDNANCIHGNIYYNNSPESQVFKCHYTGDVGWGVATHYVRPNYRYSARTPQNLGDDFYAYIILANPGKHIENSSGNVQIAANGNDSNDPRQIWHFTRQSNGSYMIVNEYDGKCLDAADAGTVNGTNIWMYPNHNHAAQRWFVYTHPSGSGFMLAPSHASNLVMDAAGGATANGTNIQLWEVNSTDAQKFSIYKLTLDGRDYPKLKPSAPKAPTNITYSQKTVSWTASPLQPPYDMRAYDVWIYSGYSAAGTPSYTGTNITGTSCTVNLNSGTYTAKIRAKNTRYAGLYTDATSTFTVTPEKEVLSFTKSNVTTDAIKLLRWQGMDAASTGEPRNRGYDPTQTSDTVGIRLNGAPMAYSTANLAKAKELLRGVKYESLTHSGAVSQQVTESGGGLRVADMLSISFGSSGGNITATVTALKPVAMRLTMADGSECLIVTPGDVNLDGEMNANDWTTIMRWTLQASSRYDVTEYPNFRLNGRSFDLWALLADMTGTGVSGNRSNRVDANDWTTIMYLTLQAWKK